MKKIYNITILGGTDGFGKWLCEYILREFQEHVSITITGRNREKGEKISGELGVVFSNDNIEAVKNADIVICCVPISLTEKIINQTLPHVKSGAVVADVTSIKQFPSAAMGARDDIVVIPTHPMFGPYISSIAGQVFVLTPEENTKNRPEYIFLKTCLENAKAKVIESTPQYHDKMMAVVQGLTHLNMFVVGETMKRLGFNINDSMDFISPIYKLMVSSIGRYLGQDPRLYADIQMYNEEILGVHEAFLETAHNYHDSVKNKNYDKFCADIIAARESFGVSNCELGQTYTDKIIYILGAQIDTLKNNIGNDISLKNIYSGDMYTGVLEKYEGGKIFFRGGSIYEIDEHEVITK